MSDVDEETKPFDVIVVGAGIQGCGVAQACAANDWTTLVLEKNHAVGLETSSSSSKLIHGGLRYLETYQFKLVRECLLEQKYLLKQASSLVEKRRFLIPLYESSKRPFWMVFLGLYLYSMLKGDWLLREFGCLSKQNIDDLGLTKSNELKKVFYFYDAQTNDEKLTQAVSYSAEKFGASFKFNQDIQSIYYKEGLYHVVLGDGVTYCSRCLVNATGPWVNYISALMTTNHLKNHSKNSHSQKDPDTTERASSDHIFSQSRVDLIQGVHVIVNREPSEDCLYVESPIDGRAVFVLPWYGKIMLGTTERLYQGDPALQKPDDQDVEYLINTYNYFFDHPICSDDIDRVFSGLRVLPTGSESQNSKSRETLFETNQTFPGYVSVVGGKLTVYRATADKVVSLLKPYLPKRKKMVDTRTISL